VFIEREDVLQQIALRQLEHPDTISSNYDFQRALDSLGRRRLAYKAEVPLYDNILDIQDSRSQLLCCLSCRLYRIKDVRLLRIVHKYFFLGLTCVEIGEQECISFGRVSQLIRDAIMLLE